MAEKPPSDHGPAEKPRGPRDWLDEPRNIDLICYAVYAACGLLLAIDILVPKHGPFAIEHLFGFYAIFGFAAYVALVILAEGLRLLVARREDYYER